jgi:hypothetical protein
MIAALYVCVRLCLCLCVRLCLCLCARLCLCVCYIFVAVQRAEEDRWVVFKYVLRAIAMVYVPVKDKDTATERERGRVSGVSS